MSPGISNIIDLDEAHKPLFAVCLEDWSEEAREGEARRSAWIERFLARGLRAKFALDDSGQAGGMIQLLPIEHSSFVEGAGLYFILCIWVHGHNRGRGNFQKRGMGKALLAAAEAEARTRGAKGIAAWGLWPPVWMRASWFKKHGFRKVDRQGLAVLLWKPFCEDVRPPRWFRAGKKLPPPVPGKITVDVFTNGWCLAMNIVAERAKRAAAEFGDLAVHREINTSERSSVAEHGFSDALFIGGKQVRTGPPPSYEKILSIIEKRARKQGVIV